MTTELIESLADALREALEHAPNNTNLARHITRAILEVAEITLECGEVYDENFSDGDLPRDTRLASTQSHKLCVDDGEVFELVREGWSYFGDPEHPNTPHGEWTTESGENDTQPSAAWIAVLDEASIADDDWKYPPGATEPNETAEEASEGDYCLWWSTSGDDEGPLTGRRFPTLRDAQIARQEAELELHRRHKGTLLCGYGIAVLNEDGDWVQCEDED